MSLDIESVARTAALANIVRETENWQKTFKYIFFVTIMQYNRIKQRISVREFFDVLGNKIPVQVVTPMYKRMCCAVWDWKGKKSPLS